LNDGARKTNRKEEVRKRNKNETSQLRNVFVAVGFAEGW
jgi:hypothetical protein